MTVKENQSICNGSEVVFDGNTWGIVTDTDLENTQVQVMDEDGGEDWIDLNRVDAILDLSPEGREHDLALVRHIINAPRGPEVIRQREGIEKANQALQKSVADWKKK